nr:hypothetical protein DBT53_10120 [Aerococcus mictus]
MTSSDEFPVKSSSNVTYPERWSRPQKGAEAREQVDPVKARQARGQVDPVTAGLLALSDRKRLSKDLPPIFARNLGKMAARLDEDSPKRGAKRMFEKAFGDTWQEAWRKRPRLLRFPDEDAPRFDCGGEYVSSFPKYRQLADAYADLSGSSKDSAYRKLARGSSISPEFKIDDSGLETLRELKEQLAEIEAALKVSPLCAGAYRCLAQYPIEPLDLGELERIREPRGLTDRIVDAKPTVELKVQNTAEPPLRNFSGRWPEEWHSWFQPAVILGTAYVRRPMCKIRLGQIADFERLVRKRLRAPRKKNWKRWYTAAYEPLKVEIAYEVAGELMQEELSRNGVGGGEYWPDDEYNDLSTGEWAGRPAKESRIPQKIRSAIYDELLVALIVTPDASLRPSLKLKLASRAKQFRDKTLCLLDEGCAENELFQVGLSESEDVALNKSESCMGYPYRVTAVTHKLTAFESSFHLVSQDGELYAISGLERAMATTPTGLFDPFAEDADRWLMLGANDKNVFRPSVWDDPSRLVPAPQGSIAATILRNRAFAPKEQRIDTLLFDDTERRLEGIAELVESHLRQYREATERN